MKLTLKSITLEVGESIDIEINGKTVRVSNCDEEQVQWIVPLSDHQVQEVENTTLKVVIEILKKILGDSVKGTDRFIEDLDMDSFDREDLLMAVEERFDIDIPTDYFERARTVEELVDLIDRLM